MPKHLRLQNLHSDLAAAVIGEDYAAAASLRDAISHLSLDDEVAVLSANSEFYRAFSARSFDQMEALWKPEGQMTCMHPGFACLTDRTTIMRSWKQVFSQFESHVSPSDVHCHIIGGAAGIVTCVERLSGPGDLDSKLIATNCFEKLADGRWCIVHHQAGPLVLPASGFDEEEEADSASVEEELELELELELDLDDLDDLEEDLEDLEE